jgi:hypothetical protein
MAVRCEGDSRVMEQVGEKQDFESELSRLGFRHEDFSLYVRRANASGGSANWTANYAVCVTNTTTQRRNIYWGGPGERWVSEFAADIVKGLYGQPSTRRDASWKPRSGNAAQLRVVSGGAKGP